MQPLSGLHRASDGYLGTVSRGQSGRGSAATAPAVVKPEPQAHGAGPFAGHGYYSVPSCAHQPHMAAHTPAVAAMNSCGSQRPAGGFTPYYGSPGIAFSSVAHNTLGVPYEAEGAPHHITERFLWLALLAHPLQQTYFRRRTGMQQSTAYVDGSLHLHIILPALLPHSMPIMDPTSAVLPVLLFLTQISCRKRRFQCRLNRQVQGHRLRRHRPCQANSKTHYQGL